ncbi:MAG: hypothetical protein ACMUIE_08355 [Thermoplasmatota archaeon]
MPSAGSRQLSLDIEEEVFRHLLFHKSLIDDSDEDMYGRIEKYLEVLSDLSEGVHVTIKDSYARSIAMILELATDNYLDPWDVDLVRFCRMFWKKVQNQERVNLMVIGKLIRMAYTVHFMKSSETLRKAELGPEEDRFDEDPFFEWMQDDEKYEVTRGILTEKAPVLVESIVHKGDRPVTLVDLLNALEDVEDEVKVLQEERRERLKAKREMDRDRRDDLNRKVYKEHTEEDIRLTWQRVNKFNGHPIPLSEIEAGFELDSSSTFISLLYLANWDRIQVWQRQFPRGEIMVKNISGDGKELKYGDLEENLRKASLGDVKLRKHEELIVEEKPIPRNWNT